MNDLVAVELCVHPSCSYMLVNSLVGVSEMVESHNEVSLLL